MTRRGGVRDRQADSDKLREMVRRNSFLILDGMLLAIDPSCISSSSKPGFALFNKGEILEVGYLQIPYTADLNVRLKRINAAFRNSFPGVNIVAIEKPPYKPLFTKRQAEAKGRPFLNVKAISSLMKAIGATVSAFEAHIPIIDVPAISWHAHARTLLAEGGDGVEKNDWNDAYLIGRTVIDFAGQLLKPIK